MKRILEKLGFRKIDEMEQFIILKGQRNAYLFLAASLVIWSLYESYCVYRYRDRLNIMPCFLLVAAVMIQTFSQLVLTRNAVKDDVDSYETEPFVKIVTLICIIACTIATVLTAVVLMGVRL